MPLLVACSSTIRTQQLEQELEATGFKMFIDPPVSNDKVYELINLLEQRELLILEVPDSVFKNDVGRL